MASSATPQSPRSNDNIKNPTSLHSWGDDNAPSAFYSWEVRTMTHIVKTLFMSYFKQQASLHVLNLN